MNENLNKKAEIVSETLETVSEAIDKVQRVILQAEDKIEHTVDPLRESAFQRFPTLFLLVVTFGITATAVGIEQIILQSSFFNERPFLILSVGVCTLILTGTLYKKLG